MAETVVNRAEGRFKIIDEDTVKCLIDMDNLEEAYEAIESSYQLYTDGLSTTATTAAMAVGEGKLFTFPSWLLEHRYFVAKLATFFPRNPSFGRPSVQPMIFVYSVQYGELLAAIEGRFFAGVRTALSSTIAARRLPSKPPEKAAIIGTGVQGKAHARVLASLVDTLRCITVYSRNRAHCVDFLGEIQPPRAGLEICAASSSSEALTDAELIICATDSATPVFEASSLMGNACIVALGGMGPAMQEVPDEVMSKAVVVVDALRQADDYGEIAGPRSRGCAVEVLGEIGAVVGGSLRVPEGRPVVFKHHGLPVTDASLAEILYLKYLGSRQN